MPGGLMIFLALICICVAMSTKQDRAAARERIKPIALRHLPFVVIFWGWVAVELWRASG
jgi:hypothetical protein